MGCYGGLVFDFWIMSKVGEGFCKASKWSFRIRCEGGGGGNIRFLRLT